MKRPFILELIKKFQIFIGTYEKEEDNKKKRKEKNVVRITYTNGKKKENNE